MPSPQCALCALKVQVFLMPAHCWPSALQSSLPTSLPAARVATSAYTGACVCVNAPTDLVLGLTASCGEPDGLCRQFGIYPSHQQ